MIKRHQFVFAAFGLAQQQSGLFGQWEADLFSADWRGDNTAAFFAAFVDFLHASDSTELAEVSPKSLVGVGS